MKSRYGSVQIRIRNAVVNEGKIRNAELKAGKQNANRDARMPTRVGALAGWPGAGARQCILALSLTVRGHASWPASRWPILSTKTNPWSILES